MKLLELFQTTSQTIHTKKPFNARQNRDVTGNFAHVVKDVDPHMVNKLSHKQDPAYDQYVEFLIKNEMAQKNPHFPRIYKNKNYTDPDIPRFSKKLWQMEKLDATFGIYTTHDQGDVCLQRIQQIADMYLIDELSEYFSNLKLTDDTVQNSSEIWSNSVKLFKKLTELKSIKLESWKDALEIIYNLKIGRLDLKQSNIMVRVTGQGPQLVFTDPFA